MEYSAREFLCRPKNLREARTRGFEAGKVLERADEVHLADGFGFGEIVP
jgi:hypothetical protein